MLKRSAFNIALVSAVLVASAALLADKLLQQGTTSNIDGQKCQSFVDQAINKLRSSIDIKGPSPGPGNKPPSPGNKPPNQPPSEPPPKPVPNTKSPSPQVRDYQEVGPINFKTLQVKASFIPDSFPFSIYDTSVDPTVSKHILDQGTPYCSTQLVEMIHDCVQAHNRNGSRCVFADVGANIGSCTVVAGLMGAKVYSFEAVKDNAYLTYLNVVQNRLTDHVKVFPIGVSNERKQIEIFRLVGNLGHNMVRQDRALFL
jgi:hypothetical protein